MSETAEGDGWEPESDRVSVPPEYRSEEHVEEHASLTQRLLRGLFADWLRTLSTLVVLGVVLMAVFAPAVAPHDPDQVYGLFKPPNSHSVGNFDNAPGTETVYHPLGTDSFGHDILSRIVYGARVSLLVAVATVTLALLVGTTVGLLAGYYGGWVDDALMRYIDFQWAFPEIVLALAIIAFAGGLGVTNVVIAIGIAYVDDFARVIRSEALRIRETEYVKAAHAVGMSDLRVMTREILPNGVAPLIVQATVLLPLAILWEAALSFLGLGVKPTTPTWGLLIADGRGYITTHWWISVMPGLAIMLTALAFNILGDGLRDAFDVREEARER